MLKNNSTGWNYALYKKKKTFCGGSYNLMAVLAIIKCLKFKKTLFLTVHVFRFASTSGSILESLFKFAKKDCPFLWRYMFAISPDWILQSIRMCSRVYTLLLLQHTIHIDRWWKVAFGRRRSSESLDRFRCANPRREGATQLRCAGTVTYDI